MLAGGANDGYFDLVGKSYDLIVAFALTEKMDMSVGLTLEEACVGLVSMSHPLVACKRGGRRAASERVSATTASQQVTVSDFRCVPACVSCHCNGARRLPRSAVEDRGKMRGRTPDRPCTPVDNRRDIST